MHVLFSLWMRTSNQLWEWFEVSCDCDYCLRTITPPQCIKTYGKTYFFVIWPFKCSSVWKLHISIYRIQEGKVAATQQNFPEQLSKIVEFTKCLYYQDWYCANVRTEGFIIGSASDYASWWHKVKFTLRMVSSLWLA